MAAVSPRTRDQAYPWAVVAGTLALSMAGNAIHALTAHGPTVSDDTAGVAALVPPALAAVALHGLLRVWRRQTPGPARNAVMGLVVAVFGMAFTLSFAGLHALALAVGISPTLAPLGPLIVDVTTVYAVADAMLLHREPPVMVEGPRPGAQVREPSQEPLDGVPPESAPMRDVAQEVRDESTDPREPAQETAPAAHLDDEPARIAQDDRADAAHVEDPFAHIAGDLAHLDVDLAHLREPSRAAPDMPAQGRAVEFTAPPALDELDVADDESAAPVDDLAVRRARREPAAADTPRATVEAMLRAGRPVSPRALARELGAAESTIRGWVAAWPGPATESG